MRSDGGALYTQIEQQLPNFVQHNHGSFSKFVEKYYEFLELNLLTFNDLDLNEDKPIQEVDNVTYTVTVASGDNAYSNNANKFFIAASASPTLNVSSGTTYIFNQSASTNAGHPLRISQTPNGRHTPGGEEYSNGINVITFGTPGEAGAQTSVYISTSLANTSLYYYCNTHSGMGGVVSIANTTPFISLENGNTESANSSTDYIDLENPNRQGSQFLSGETIEGDESGATGVVRGKYANTQVYVEETNNGNFRIGERIVGDTSRASANVTLYARQALNASRNVKAFQDIDKAPLGFVELFRKEFLAGVPKGSLGDKAGLLKNIKDFYRAKGNEASFQFIFRLLFGKEDVTFYYPSTDMLRLSDGRWTKNKTIKIDQLQSNNFSVLEGKVIRGSYSNVTALVERTQTYQVGATTISELFISNVDDVGATADPDTLIEFTTFQANDTITTTTADSSGNYGQANVAGILSSIEISGGGSNYSVGDELSITGGGGAEAAAKVASVSDATISSVDIFDPGDGYSVGDTVVFANEGTGGSGGSARIASITPTANVSVDTLVINTNKDDTISAAAFSTPLTAADANTHIYSNTTTTFTVPFDGRSGTIPKAGDFIAKFGGAESVSNYSPSTSKFGTVIATTASSPATTGTITYALGSIVYTATHSAAATLNNFINDDAIAIYDLTKASDGTAKSANGHNATIRTTGASLTINGTPTANTNVTYHGALTGTVTEASIGGIRSIQVLSSGQGYSSIPVVTVANSIIVSYGSSLEKTGANSVFITLANSIANQFTSNTIVKNASNSASGIVLGPISSNTALVATGNTVLRVQMTSATAFVADDVLTSYQNNAGEQPIGVGDFGQANISTSGTTATFTQADHGYGAGQRIVVTGSTSGTDAAVYNNNHTVATVSNSSTYTVTLASDPTDDSESDLTIRRIVTANTAYERLLTEDSTATQLSFENGVGTSSPAYSTSTSNGFIISEVGIDTSNVVFANTGIAGNSAFISIAAIAIGGIQSVTIYNFGAGYTSAPTIDATAVGDGNASLVSTLGAVADYDGFFDGAQGLLSGQNKMQDNFYYQDFSYVIKTDINTEVYREKITNLVHPSGLKMFGEVVMYANAANKLFNNGANTINDTVANTALVAGTLGVPNFMHHKITFSNLDTASSNVQIGIQTSLFQASIAPAIAHDLKIQFPLIDYDLILEHENAGIALEGAGDTIGFETGTFLEDLFTFVKASTAQTSVDGDVRDVKFNTDGTKMFMLGRGSDGVYEYSVSTAFDVSTITYVRTLDISGQDTAANSIEFNLDGTKLFMLGQSDDEVSEYALSTGFDLSTASFTDAFDVSTQEGQPYGLAFNNDGTKMYVCGWLGDDINEYTLTTGFDVSTASYSQNFSILSEGGRPSAVQFSSDGTFMYVLDGSNTTPTIFQYTLTVAFDISTASYTNKSFVTTDQEAKPRGFCFGNNGLQMFLCGWGEDKINEYTVNAALQEHHGTAIGGTLALEEDGVSNIQFEEFYDSLIQEDGSNLEIEDASFDTFNVMLLEGDTGDRIIMESITYDDEEGVGIAYEDSGSSKLQAKNYLLHEPIDDSSQIISEDAFDIFYIQMEENVDEFYLEQEGTDAEEYFLLEDDTGGFLYVEEQRTDLEPLRMTLEIHDVMLELDTRFIITDRMSASGAILPMIQFPETESGAVHIDMGYGSQLKLEDDEYLLLERTEGMFPLYMAMENTMEDEVIVSHEIQINPIAYDEDIEAVPFVVHQRPHEDVTWYAENGDRFTFETPLYSSASAILRSNLEDPYGTGRSSSFDVRAEGNINVTMGEIFELLSEAGDRFIEESIAEEGTFLSETGDEYILERSYGPEGYQNYGTENPITKDSVLERSFVSEVYDRRASITGLNTQFNSDFSAPIILETYSDENKTVQDATFITLESHTEDGDLILIEGGDRIFVPIELETASGVGNLGLESQDEASSPNRRLVYPELLDFVLDEEVVALEEDFKMLIEEGTAGSALTFIHENGTDTLVLEHQTGNYGTEQSSASTIENFTNDDLRIEDLVANIALETYSDEFKTVNDSGGTGGNSLLLEERTPTGIGTVFLFEDGDRLLDETSGDDLSNAIFILNEESYMETFSSGQIEVNNSASDSLCQIELIGDFRFPYGVEYNGKFTYISNSEYAGDTATISSVTDHSLVEVDFGNIALEDGYHVLNEDGDKTKRDFSDSTAKNYKLEYGVYTQASTLNSNRFMKVELGTTDCNNIGRGNFFVINGFTSTAGGLAGQITPEELGERLGNDVVYEDGTLILFEDGEVTQDPNAIVLEDDSTYLTFEEHTVMILEDLHHNYKVLNLDTEKYRVDSIANNTFMKLNQETSLFTDAPFKVNHLESVNARVTS